MLDAPVVRARPLAQILLRKLLFASLFIAVAIFAIQLLASYRQQRQLTLATMHSLAKTFEPAVALSLWNYEDKQLESLVKGIGMHPDVVLVDVIDGKGKVSASWRRPGTLSVSEGLQVRHPMLAPGTKDKLAGTLVIASSEELVRAHLLGMLSSLVVTTVLLLAALASVLWSLVHRYALRPLAQLSNHVRARSSGAAEEPFDPHQTEVSEILSLQDGFRQLMQQVAESHARIAAQNQGLEQQVVARTLDLERKNTELAAADRAKSAFLANMSHEIRTPMNGILGMLKLLEHTELTPRQLDYKQKAEGATRSLLGIINDILDFSKIEAGKMELEVQPFGLGEVMRDLSVIVAANLGDKNIEVLFSIDPLIPPRLLGDAMRLRQVLLNLAGNAIKFTEKGEVLVAVRALGHAADSVRLEFSVRDSGIGIAADKLHSIFEGFSQAESSTTRRFGGSGLGLAICKRMVALMGAEMQVQSSPGQGSRFYFTVQFEIAAAAKSAAADALESAGRAGGAGQKVLIVDDNATAREVLMEMAGAIGWQSDCMASGEDALAHLQAPGTGPYQIILMDWRMPGLDGWETTRRLRQINSAHQAPVIIMVSAHGLELLTEKSKLDTDMLDAYLVKPVTASMLFDAVVQAQAQRSGRTSPSEPTSNTPPPSRPQYLAGLRLLVVEDNLLNQQIALELLTQNGALVEIAGGGLAGVALALAAEPLFDAVLMDMQMPDIDGLEASRRIRSDPRMAPMPIIAMTANAMEVDKQACRDAGMVDHVSKPIDLDNLIATLLRHTRPPAPAAQATMEVESAVKRLGGNREFFAKVVASFCADAQTQLLGFEQSLAQGRAEDAARSLHTLRGFAATVGARGLEKSIAAAEATLKAGSGLAADGPSPATREHLQEIERQLALAQRFFEALGLATHAAPEEAAAVPAQPRRLQPEEQAALLQALDALETDLRARKMRAVKAGEALRQQFGAALAGRLDALLTATAALDFERALQASLTLRSSLLAEHRP